jgi:hypothetical protein
MEMILSLSRDERVAADVSDDVLLTSHLPLAPTRWR